MRHWRARGAPGRPRRRTRWPRRPRAEHSCTWRSTVLQRSRCLFCDEFCVTKKTFRKAKILSRLDPTLCSCRKKNENRSEPPSEQRRAASISVRGEAGLGCARGNLAAGSVGGLYQRRCDARLVRRALRRPFSPAHRCGPAAARAMEAGMRALLHGQVLCKLLCGCWSCGGRGSLTHAARGHPNRNATSSPILPWTRFSSTIRSLLAAEAQACACRARRNGRARGRR